MNKENLTIKDISEGIRKKKASAKEITKDYLDRINRLDGQLDSFLTILNKEPLEQAEKVDKLISEDQEVGLLAGVPYALKDVVVTKNIKTTAGSKILADFNPPYSATVFEKLESENAVLLGKTNLDEFAMGGSTENSAFKVTKNPWDKGFVPGGSSGGSAAALAADFCAFSIGSDTGGSIRQPASFCGVVGLKPTYGRVSRYGLIAMASSLDQIGPFTKTSEDAAIVLNVLSGFDKRDSTSVQREAVDFTKGLTGKIDGVKVGVPKEYFGEGVSQQVKETVEKAINKLGDLGAKIVDISLPSSKASIAVYYLIMPSEVSANLARFDGVRFGGPRELFGSEVKRRIMLGTYALSSGYYDAYYLKAAKVRTLIHREFQDAFKKVDVIAGPTSPILPFKIGEKVNDPLQMYLADILTVPVNLAGLPGISIPCGVVSGLPVGLQIIGNHWQEQKILNVAHTYEQNFPITERPQL